MNYDRAIHSLQEKFNEIRRRERSSWLTVVLVSLGVAVVVTLITLCVVKCVKSGCCCCDCDDDDFLDDDDFGDDDFEDTIIEPWKREQARDAMQAGDKNAEEK